MPEDVEFVTGKVPQGQALRVIQFCPVGAIPSMFRTHFIRRSLMLNSAIHSVFTQKIHPPFHDVGGTKTYKSCL
jgi:hypothetical protein